MSDSEMDKVTAGVGAGLDTACCAASTAGYAVGYAPVYAGYGVITASSVGAPLPF